MSSTVVPKVGSVKHDLGFRNASLSSITTNFQKILMSKKQKHSAIKGIFYQLIIFFRITCFMVENCSIIFQIV